MKERKVDTGDDITSLCYKLLLPWSHVLYTQEEFFNLYKNARKQGK